MKYGAIFLIFFIFGCNSKSENYEKIADKLTVTLANRLQEEKELYLIGIGGGMMDNIKMMHMGFQYFHQVDIKTGRELLVYTINEYLKEINNKQELRPYLHNFPFTVKNIEISIWVQNPDRSDVPLDQIYYISAIDGKLSYYIDDPKNNSRIAVLEETFEEAIQENSLGYQ